MPHVVVLKRLTQASDLGWFRSIFYGRSLKGKQKGITLNKDVINHIWRNLLRRQDAYEVAKAAGDKKAASAAGHIPIAVELHGPGGKPPIFANRLLALQDKNWRLNGAFMDAPPTDPDRFDVMQEGDYALIGFDGVEWPTQATVVLLSAANDAALLRNLPKLPKGQGSMVRMEPDVLQELADASRLPPGHPIRVLAGDPEVEAAVEQVVRRRGRARAVNADDFDRGKASAEETGRRGEVLVNEWLSNNISKLRNGHRWMWPDDAAAPYDFERLLDGDLIGLVDVKSTTALWIGDFYMSFAELYYAANSPVPYQIYRASEVSSSGAWLRISSDIREFAKAVIASLDGTMPRGSRVTTVAVSPRRSGLRWGPPVRLSYPGQAPNPFLETGEDDEDPQLPLL